MEATDRTDAGGGAGGGAGGRDGVERGSRLSATLLMSAAAVVAAAIAMFGEAGTFSGVTVLGALAGLVPWALVAGGVRVPAPAFALMGLAAASIVVLVDGNPGGMFPVMLLVVWVTRTSPSPWVVGGTVAAGLSLVIGLAVVDGSAHETGAVYFTGGVGISWLAGAMVRRQEQLTDELRELHRQSLAHAADAERTRIAREVHDVVAHSLTVVMLHLTGARRVLGSDPARADEALGRAEEVGRESLDSIRQVVSLLRTSEADGDAVPLPGVAELPALVERYVASGLPVSAHLALTEADVEPAAGLAVFRVVQEALTNVLRHAPGARCTVEVERSGSTSAVVRVVDSGGGAGVPGASSGVRAGLGLRGMGERVRALGGELHAGPTAGGGWCVEATVPARLVTHPVEEEIAWVPAPTTGR